MAPGVGQDQQVIAMAQGEHVGLVEEVETEADLEGMVGEVVRVKAVNKQMLKNESLLLNHRDESVNNRGDSGKDGESDSLTIEELDDASDDEEDKLSNNNCEPPQRLNCEEVSVLYVS